MSFWGVEIKPGKPYSHHHDNLHGRLRISQATLGNGKSTNKSTVQCNVGNKAPILLCHLIPDSSETCHLDLEFEEPEESVVFSVLGQRSVHLSGYYIDRPGRVRDLGGDETDSYGEDIAETDTSGSFSADDDEYESDFIDDDDSIQMYPPSSRRKSGVVIEEIEDDKPSNENANRRRLKKKHQLSDSDNGVDGSQGQLLVKRNSSAVLDSEDEDGFPILFPEKRGMFGKSNTMSDEQIDGEDMQRTDADPQDGSSVREISQPSDTVLSCENGQENERSKKKKKKKTKDKKAPETTSEPPVELGASVMADQDKEEKDAGVQKDNDVQLGGAEVETQRAGDDTDGKSKKKKKSKKAKKLEASVSGTVDRTEEKSIEVTKEDPNDDKMDQDPPVSGELAKQSETVDPSVPLATDAEANGKQKKKNRKKRAKDDRGSDAEGGEVAGVNQTDSKKKRKNDKSSDKDLEPAQQSGEKEKTEGTERVLKTRAFSNGLVVEELAMGKPDGQKAAPGKKVSVNYIGKLKNGKIFDSTVGKKPFSFRLGIGQVIKGWDVGVNGMRVGDKRRLTIPPSYGYGPTKTGPIPPNSWLLFDIELVSVK